MAHATYTITEPELNLLVAKVIAAHERGDTVTITPAGQTNEPAGKPLVGMTSGRRVEIPPSTPLYKNYLGHPLEAQIDSNGKVVWNGTPYDNLTQAALASGLSVNPKCNSPSGYEWWQVEENGQLVRVVNSRFTEPKKNK
jgi:hypothetical protein